IRSSLELRNEAIASLAMTDVRFADVRLTDIHEPADPNQIWDADLKVRARRNSDGSISVRRVVDDSEIALLPGVSAGIDRMHAFSPDRRYLAVTYFGGRNVVWDIQTCRPLIENIPGSVSDDCSADSESMAVICQDGELRRFALKPLHSLPSFALDRPYHLLRIRPQGDWFSVYQLDKP